MSGSTKGLTSSNAGTLYFAYGSNLSTRQMRERCPGSIPVAVARLDGYKWIICRRHYANIVELPEGTGPSHESTVWGLVYLMTDEDEARLDLYEGHNSDRNASPTRNPDPLTWQKIPYLQGSWNYNKHYLPVTVTQWLTEKPPLHDTEESLKNRITVLAYVDEDHTSNGTIIYEYIGRMNRGIEESTQLGMPREWMDQVMRKPGWVDSDDFAPEGYVGDERGYISSGETPPESPGEEVDLARQQARLDSAHDCFELTEAQAPVSG